MAAPEGNEVVIPCNQGRHVGAIVFDHPRLRQADLDIFSSDYWDQAAQPVAEGGRGSAWFVDAPFGRCVLRHYRRGGLVARFSTQHYFWQGADRTRSFAEFRLMRLLRAKGLSLPRPLAAMYMRQGWYYRAALLMERLENTQSLAHYARNEGAQAPWEAAGQLIARFHRVGLNHADLNAHNILFDSHHHGWLIDFDRSTVCIIESQWRERNLVRLRRSLHKLRDQCSYETMENYFDRLYQAYDAQWKQGI